MAKDDLLNATLPASKMAELFGCSTQWLRRLASDGVFPRSTNGRYNFLTTCQGYIAWLRDEQRRAAKGEPATKLALAKAQLIENRIARQLQSVIETEDAQAAFQDVARVLRDELSRANFGDLPPNIVPMARRSVARVLDRLDGRFDAAITAIRAGKRGADIDDAVARVKS